MYLLHVLGITKHADLHLGARDVGQLDGATETLVLLRIIVLQSNLELDGLCELPVLLPCLRHDQGDGLLEGLSLQLTAKKQRAGVKKVCVKDLCLQDKTTTQQNSK